jgi:hypothetical protein
MTRTKYPLLVSAALFALGGSALAGDGDQGPSPGLPQAFERSAPRLDLGSEAYPSTVGLGPNSAGEFTNHVTRNGTPAHQRGFDVGSEAYPEPR